MVVLAPLAIDIELAVLSLSCLSPLLLPLTEISEHESCSFSLLICVFLYALAWKQMEYCEQSTLRDVIDKQSLYKDEGRVWRLFRELVDGIAHIHEQVISLQVVLQYFNFLAWSQTFQEGSMDYLIDCTFYRASLIAATYLIK